jgi:hypothetical protein
MSDISLSLELPRVRGPPLTWVAQVFFDTTPSALLIKAFGGIDFLVATRFVALSFRPVKSMGPLDLL